jgi:adenine deaminase
MKKLDLLIKNVNIIDVHLLRVFEGWVGMRNGRFAYVESGAIPRNIVSKKVIDAYGLFMAPGLIDAHMHIESSLLSPSRFSEAVIPYGTVAVLADSHEVANVAGAAGVRQMIEAGKNTMLTIFHAIPSCVPATSNDLEWAKGKIDVEDLASLINETGVIALGELMDYASLLGETQRHSELLEFARKKDLLREGHIPTLKGTELSDYLFFGISSDHTLTFPEKIREQVSKGVTVMLQYKSLQEKNIHTVLKLPDRSQILLVTDDVEPSLLRGGHLSIIVQKAIELGLPLEEAYASATIRPARYLRLLDRGSIRPGARADFILLEQPDRFPPQDVYIEGRKVAERGELTSDSNKDEVLSENRGATLSPAELPPKVDPNVHLRLPKNIKQSGYVYARVVTILNSKTTETGIEKMRIPVVDGFPKLLEDEDLNLVSIISRDGDLSTIAMLKGLGLRKGAIATSFAHDSHNILTIGREKREMLLAAQSVINMGGGIVFVEGERISASLALPYFGLISGEDSQKVARELEHIENKLKENGVKHSRPFLLISILSLSVSPYYKFSVRGIIDTERRMLLSAWENS